MSETSEKSSESKTFEDMSRLMRGETPEDISEKCLKLCSDYLGGAWNKITVEQITVRRISGGYTNQLYYCGLTEGIPLDEDEPKEVTVRFYGKKWFNACENNERLIDMVIVLLASDKNLGPKIYGIFKEGEIGEYIECHQFRIKDQTNPLLVRELSKKLAQFHSLDVPLAKDCDWLKRYFNEFYDKGYQEFPIDHIIKEVNAQNLIKRDLKEEYEWLLRCIDAMNSPIVFSHNDFRGSNLLVHEIVNDNNPRLITLCDFEYSCYYYRGFDLGICLSEFGQTNLSTPQPLPSDKVLEEFLRGYLDESIKIHGEEYGLNDQNSMRQLINETKVFSLAGNMFIIMFLFHAKELPFSKNKNEIIAGVDKIFGHYLEAKAQLEGEGLLPIPS